MDGNWHARLMWFELSSSNESVVGQGSVDLELQHGEEEVFKESMQSGVPRTSPWL
jgi:hypothetical protein